MIDGGKAASDTIFALSSGALPAAIAVVRISGSASGATLLKLAGMLPPPRRATYTELRDSSGEILDRALILWMPGRANATGEDSAELHLHGGRAVVGAVLTELSRLPGLRPAEPGAFTRRAFANGKLGLDQVEGLRDLVAAETEEQRRQAIRRAEGGLGRLIEQWRVRLLRAAANIEAAIEYGEEEPDAAALDPAITREIDTLAFEIDGMVAQPPAERLRDGVRIVVGGPVNSGKSSLVNALAGREVAIVAEVEGTTRDLIEAPVDMDGVPVILIDSAGLRSAEDPIERVGIARAQTAASSADIVIWTGAPADGPQGPRLIRVKTKLDRQPGGENEGFDVATSVIDGRGLAQLRRLIVAAARTVLPPPGRLALDLRHRDLLSEAAADLRSALGQADPLLIAEHLRGARLAFDRITGASGVEEMLDALFARFCIGK